MKRNLCYQLMIIENYQKAISKELGPLADWVRSNIQKITITSEEDFCKKYEIVHDQLCQLCSSSKELYKRFQETKTGILFQLGILMTGQQTPTEENLSIGVPASVSKSSIDGLVPEDFPTGVKKNLSMCIQKESGICSPKLDIAKINTSRVIGVSCEDITSESKWKKEEQFVKHSSGSYPLINSLSSETDQSPEEVLSTNHYKELIVTKVEDKYSTESSSYTSLPLNKEDPHIFSNKSKSSNDNQTYIVRSEWEVWDTFEFTTSDSDTNGSVESEGEKTSNGQVISTLDAAATPECSSQKDALCQSNPIEQVLTSKNDISSPQQHLNPNSIVGPVTSHFPNLSVDRAIELPVATVIPEFQFCRWQELEIRVSHAIDPHYFYIQHSGQELPELMRQLNYECSKNSAKLHCIPLINSYVCAWLPESKQWYRSCVIRIVGNEATMTHDDHHLLMEVLCVDYGFSACLPLKFFKSLPPTYCTLPQQALCVSLANISPMYGVTWSRSEINWFMKSVKNKTFFARLYQKSNIMTVALFSEKGKIGIMRRGSKLSQKMAAAGLARYSDGNCVSPKTGASIPLCWKQRLVKLLSESTNLRK
ncbi:uncharacterized protein LOC119952284 isoform X2 [Scyliorhinus canicula]|nr:uncharacterized protein LOC119952284 isoform X2 [Scyliorhinus canicula]XP_038631834.1 uncharacterized protein LOC119952284 isoform X2 [Scyliorhinus canicula]